MTQVLVLEPAYRKYRYLENSPPENQLATSVAGTAFYKRTVIFRRRNDALFRLTQPLTGQYPPGPV
ncbi:MAG: hypothetical protein WC082_03955 [Victivallales bacterium]